MNSNQLEEIYNLWPINIGEFSNPQHKTIKNDLINFCNEYEKKLPEGNEQLKDNNYVGNYNLYQSKYNLLKEYQNNKTLNGVFQFIAKSVLKISKIANEKELEKLNNNNLKFKVNVKESWFIRYNKGGFILPHNHQDCSWSCVYYVRIGKDAGKKNGSTFFLRPYSGSAPKLDFGGKYSREDTAVINAEEGKLLVWPNYVYHGSHPYAGKEDRMIISANFTVDIDNNK